MIDYIKKFIWPLKALFETRFIWVTIPCAFIVWFFAPWEDIIGVITMIAVVWTLLGLSHWLRLVLFPSVDLSDLIEKAANDKNLPAALLALGILAFMLVSVIVPVLVIR